MKCHEKPAFCISSDESERIQFLKIWFTLMVIFVHSYTEEVRFVNETLVLQIPIWLDWIKYVISQVISNCAVPGYFFISAVLLYKKDFTWKENIKKKLKTLLVPYLIFNTFWIVFYYFAQHIPFFSVYFPQGKNIIADWGPLQLADAYLGFSVEREHFPLFYPLWFIRDLMMLNLAAVFIKKLIDRLPKTIFAVLILIIIFNVNTYIFGLNTSSIVYFSLGYYFVKYSMRFNDADKIKAPYIIAIYGTCVLLDCATRFMKINYLFHYASIISGLIFFYRCTTKIQNRKLYTVLKKIAKYSFPIYLFHEMNLSILKKILVKLLPPTAFWQTILYFGIPMIIFILCTALSIVLDKYFHRIYAVLVGSRNM